MSKNTKGGKGPKGTATQRASARGTGGSKGKGATSTAGTSAGKLVNKGTMLPNRQGS